MENFISTEASLLNSTTDIHLDIHFLFLESYMNHPYTRFLPPRTCYKQKNPQNQNLMQLLMNLRKSSKMYLLLNVSKSQIIEHRTIIEHSYHNGKKCIFIGSKDLLFWIFYKKGNIYIHSSKPPSESFIPSICEFRSGIPDYENLFLGISDGKLNAYSLNYLSLDFNNPIPLVKVPLMKTVRNILAFPYEKPKYIVFTTSQTENNNEIFSLNLMEIKGQTLVNSTSFEESQKILKIKTLDLDINGKIVKNNSIILKIQFQLISALIYIRRTSTQSHSSTVNLYQLIEDKSGNKKVDLNLLHQIKINTDAVTDVFTLSGALFICVGNLIQGYQIVMNEEKQFDAKIIYNLATEKV